MALDRENKALPYLTGRAIAIVEHYAKKHFGLNTFNTMFNTPEYPISVFVRYVPQDDPDWKEVAGTPFPRHLIPVEQSQAWIGYYHQKAELGRNENRIEIGNRVAEIRKSKGLNQEQLAEMTGLNRCNISKIENGRYNISIDILNKICEALNAKIEIKEG